MPQYPPPPLSCLRGQGDTPVPPGVPRYSHHIAPQYRHASPSTPIIRTSVLPCVPMYPQYTIPSAAMHLPRLPPHHSPHRHVSPSASTIESTVHRTVLLGHRYLWFGHSQLSVEHRYLSFTHGYLSFGDRYLSLGQRYLSFGHMSVLFGHRYLSFRRTPPPPLVIATPLSKLQ